MQHKKNSGDCWFYSVISWATASPSVVIQWEARAGGYQHPTKGFTNTEWQVVMCECQLTVQCFTHITDKLFETLTDYNNCSDDDSDSNE